jgi:hypothetical protein
MNQIIQDTLLVPFVNESKVVVNKMDSIIGSLSRKLDALAMGEINFM